MKQLSYLLLALSLSLAGCAPKSDLDKANTEIARLTEQVERLEAKLKEAEQRLARKPAMPVKISLRKALLGGGNIAVFSTTIKQDFPVLVTVKSKALGTSKQFRLNLSAANATEMGGSDGVQIDLEDEILLENSSYEAATYRFGKP